GAVCNLGRYAMPIVPLLVAGLAVVIGRLATRRGVLAVALALAAWSGLLALRLWQDPRAANDSALLFARSSFADPNVYVPNLFFPSPLYLAPGHAVRVAAWLSLAGLLAWWLGRAARARAGESPMRSVSALLAFLAVGTWALERWPSGFHAPRYVDAI